MSFSIVGEMHRQWQSCSNHAGLQTRAPCGHFSTSATGSLGSVNHEHGPKQQEQQASDLGPIFLRSLHLIRCRHFVSGLSALDEVTRIVGDLDIVEPRLVHQEELQVEQASVGTQIKR